MAFDRSGGDFEIDGDRLFLQALLVFLVSLGFLMLMAPTASFKGGELGVCESGAVRDVLAGHVILPHYGSIAGGTGGKMIQTPPLFWWASALSVRVLGWTEVGLRAPSIVTGAITCAILYAWLAPTLGRGAALWAVAALLSCKFFVDNSRQPRMDEMLTMFLTGAMVCLERALIGKAPRRTGFAAAAAVMMGLAVLTKGPIGVVLPGLTIMSLFALRRQFLELFSFELIAIFATAVGIALVWFWAAYELGGWQFFQWQVLNGLWQRFTGGEPGPRGIEITCRNPFYFHLPHLISGFLPWSLYLPALVLMMCQRRRSLPGEVTFAACWFVAIVGFFSSSAGKCVVYILPAFPPLAALLGWLIAEQPGGNGKRGLSSLLFDMGSVATGVGAFVVIIISAGLLIFGVPVHLIRHLHDDDRDFLAIFVSLGSSVSIAFLLWSAAWFIGAIMALRGLWPGNSRIASCGVAAIALTGTVFWFGSMDATLTDQRSLKSFAAEVNRIIPATAELEYIGAPDCDFVFYSAHSVGFVNQFQCDGGSGAEHYFLIQENRLASLSDAKRACLSELAQSVPVGHQGRRFLMVESRK